MTAISSFTMPDAKPGSGSNDPQAADQWLD